MPGYGCFSDDEKGELSGTEAPDVYLLFESMKLSFSTSWLTLRSDVKEERLVTTSWNRVGPRVKVRAVDAGTLPYLSLPVP